MEKEQLKKLIAIVNESFEYPEALEQAPDDVKRAIEAFHAMSDAEKENTPLLYYLLGQGTPAFKMSKEDSHYINRSSNKQKCGNCEFAYQKVVNEKFICSQIEGEIQPEAWCRLWEKGNQ